MKVVSFFSDTFHFLKVHLYKDTRYAGEYLAKCLNAEFEIVTQVSSLPAGEYDGVALRVLDRQENYDTLEFVARKSTAKSRKIIQNFFKAEAKTIDVLVMTSVLFSNMFAIRQYKRYNPNGKVYLKLDGWGDNKLGLVARLKKFIKDIFFVDKFIRNVDVFSIETQEGFDKLSSNGMFGRNVASKLVLAPIGVVPMKSSASCKENLIITVGRLGSPHKNNEMLIEALGNVGLGEFRVALIGESTSEFEALVESRQRANTKLELVGAVYDREKLFDWYRRAKVFVLTSNVESSGLVLVEAFCNDNYIITTDVGCARDLIQSEVEGKIIPIGDTAQLTNAIQAYIDRSYVSLDNSARKTQYYWNEIMMKVAKRLQ